MGKLGKWIAGSLLIGIVASVTRTPVIGGSVVCAAFIDELETEGDFGLRNVDGTRLTEFSEVHINGMQDNSAEVSATSAAQIKENSQVLRGVRDTDNVALHGGISSVLASDTVPNQLVIANKVKLSDEDILADNPELASLFMVLDDEEKYAAWEKEEMPKLLLEIEASSIKSSTKQKKWARKAIMSSEMTVCNRKNYLKDASYYPTCREKKRVWFVNVCISYDVCDSGDTMVWPECHHDCKGWSDDGTRCWKKCSSQSTAPTECGTTMCTEDKGACDGAVANMVVSIESMLSNFMPGYGRLKAIGTTLVEKGLTAAMGVMKNMAKLIAKKFVRKAKKKVKKFMKAEVKGQMRQLKDWVVHAILHEAAEAFAIERVKQELKTEFPSIDDVARELDPIGVMDVVGAFNHENCDATEIAPFPTCSNKNYVGTSLNAVKMQADYECCFGYNKPNHRKMFNLFNYYSVSCKSKGSHVSVLASTVNADDEDGLFNDNADPDPDDAVDVLWDPEPIVSAEDMAICLYCTLHESCSDNEVPGANLTIFDTCTDSGCCSMDESQKSTHGQFLSDNAPLEDSE